MLQKQPRTRINLKKCKRQYNGEARGEGAIPKREPRGEHDTASGRRPTSFSSIQSTAVLKDTMVSSIGLILGRHKYDRLAVLTWPTTCRCLGNAVWLTAPTTIQVQFKHTE